ncbi:GntR family transcriptional regulator [Nitrospirillum sp. BR 11828]|uniref:GntR family transcriptional regulator n=1 Tax=Nitrospirillum sp. BR 11828 TaxID=3104325 RepID=UPI002AC9FC9A|nr:GntR family transcriptional regulator [Nitrospirillum sp. BR 11828]MDZ5649465.1 GntR family transcriptional regulator [Nitrospirillum sp. BR 11828]
MDHSSPDTGLTPDQLDHTAPTPLYHQIFLVLREKIRNGEFAANSVMPGEQELSKLFNVSRITVKRSLNELAAHDLVSRHRGRGTVVTASATLPQVHGSFDNLIESLKTMGLETEVEVLDVTELGSPPAVAALLDVEAGTPVQRVVRLRKLAGEPFSYIVQFMPLDIAAGISRTDMETVPTLVSLERIGFAPHEAEQWITAVAAEPPVAAALEMAPGAPVLRVERVVRDKSGRGVQIIHANYRPDRFKYHMRSGRKAIGGWKSEG